jgi:nitroreductase
MCLQGEGHGSQGEDRRMVIDELERIIKGRRSIRQWKREDVPDERLRKAIELATWAPNGGNFQGWHFIVVKNRGVITRMADAVQSVVDKMASWPEAAPWQNDMNRSQKNASYFRNAPACVGVFVTPYQSHLDKVLEARKSFDDEAGPILASRKFAPTPIQNAAAAVATMLLVLHNMGLGTVWLGGPLVAKKEIESILKVSDKMDLVCLVAVGYPNESPQKDRKPVDQVLEFIL